MLKYDICAEADRQRDQGILWPISVCLVDPDDPNLLIWDLGSLSLYSGPSIAWESFKYQVNKNLNYNISTSCIKLDLEIDSNSPIVSDPVADPN